MDWAKLLNTTRTRELENGSLESSKEPGDERTEFDRDYDRAIYSSPVRRLQDKAQVFPLERNDFVRTRLTHSHEVATVARGLATDVTTWLTEIGEISHEEAHAIRLISMTCGLLHDLGNPPFGHAGETAIATWFDDLFSEKDSLRSKLGGINSQRVQDFIQFNGNAQTLRLVAHLQMLADRHGLNLTVGTVSALSKYTAASHEIDRTKQETRKAGFFKSEQHLIEQVRSATGAGSARNPITYLVEAADDIVYSAVDLEDGLRKQLFDWNTLHNALSDHLPDSQMPLLDDLKDSSESYIKQGGLIESRPAFDDACVQIFRTKLIGRHVPAVVDAFKQNYDDIMEGNFHGELVREADTWPLLDACQTVGENRVYACDPVLRTEVQGRNILHDLLELFWEGIRSAPHESALGPAPKKIYHLTSRNYRILFRERFKEAGSESEKIYARLQLLTDYVAGMTDSFAVSLHHRLHHE